MGIHSMGSSMNSLPQLISLMKTHGVQMGQHCKSRATLTKIAFSISNSMHKRLTEAIRTTEYPISLIIGQFINYQLHQ